MSELRNFDELSNEQMRIVDSVCVTFERELRSEKTVTIEAFLASVSNELLAPVFQELMAIELEWQRSRSSEIDVPDYLKRFPDRHDEIHALVNAGLKQKANDERRGQSEASTIRVSVGSGPTSGTVIDGRYTIIEPIGEGGMGTVFLAEQHTPVTRQVAIKFIKGGMDSKAVLARFDIERSALAMMDHPGIAQVYDGGQTADGLPYFVMELVRGIPITRFCDEKCFDVRARLNLFVSVCNAVQHAHLKGIIHRDLKPANVLVSEVDGQPFIKVIDFGVAKAVDLKLTKKSLAATDMIVGTPAYMSPEQANPTSIDIDMRTDVYSLGVVLFELLVGTPPHDTSVVEGGSVLDFLRMIRDVDSPRPSTKVNSAAKLSEIAADRRVEPEKLARLLRGELDWIALRALEKDRSRRYETVNSFARDVERFLTGDVVEARPPSNAYRVRKFVTRNKGTVIAASLLFLTLLAGIVGTGWGMLEAQEQTLAAEREVIAKEAARQNEARERQYAEAIAEFVESDFLALTTLEGRLDYGDEDSSINKDSTLRDLLNRASEKLSTRTDLAPRIEARLRWIIGRSYRRLAEFQKAIDSFERSVELYTIVLGNDDLKTLRAQDGLADSLQSNGQHVRAQTLLTETIARKKSIYGTEHVETMKSISLLAANYRISGDPAKAVPILKEVLARTKSLHGPRDRGTLVKMYQLAMALKGADQPAEAMALLEQTLQIQSETLKESHPDIHSSKNLLGELYFKSGQLKKAKPLLEEGLEWSKMTYGPESPSTLYSMARLSMLYRNLRQLNLALPMSQKTLELARIAFGSNHPNVSKATTEVAMVHRAAGDFEKALPLFNESYEIAMASVGARHPNTLLTMANVAACYRSMGQLRRSIQMNEKCLELAKEILGETHSQTIIFKQNLAAGYWSSKNLERSVPLFEEVLSYWEKRAGRNHPNTLRAMANVGINYRDAKRYNVSVPLLEEVYHAVAKNPAFGFVGPELLDAYLQAGQMAQGRKLAGELIDGARNTFPEDSLNLSSPLALMGKILLRSNVLEDAEPVLRESMNIRQRLAPDSWSTHDTVAMLGESLHRQRKYAAGAAFLATAYEGMKLHATKQPQHKIGRRKKVLEELVEAFAALNQSDDVAKWEAELARLRADSDSK